MKLTKYYLIASHTWSQMFEYRLSFIIWRLRSILQVLTLLFLWIAVLPQNGSFASYNQSSMLTYILGTSFVASLVLSSKTLQIGDEINEGTLSGYLLRPINFFSYWFARDIGDKAMNVGFAIIETTIIILLLHPPIFLQTHMIYNLLSVMSLLLAIILYFLFSLVLSFIGFWSRDVWGPRFIFSQLLSFFAGGLFPLDILPKPVFQVLSYLPFTYMQYFPLKIYLGQQSLSACLLGIGICSIWILILYYLVQFVWHKGLVSYTASGS